MAIELALLDWGTVAAIIVALAAIGGLIIQFFKKDKPWRRAQEKHNIRLTALDEQVKALSKRADNLKEALQAHDGRDEKDFERLEAKIEKLTDLMIDMLSDNKPPPPKRKK